MSEPTSEERALELQEMVDIKYPSRWNGLDSAQVSFDIQGAKQLIEQDRLLTVERAYARLLLNARGSDFVKQLIEHTQNGRCANCGGDGFNMTFQGPFPCVICEGTGIFKDPK